MSCMSAFIVGVIVGVVGLSVFAVVVTKDEERRLPARVVDETEREK